MGPGSGESKQLVVPSAGSARPALRPATLNLSNSPVSAASPAFRYRLPAALGSR